MSKANLSHKGYTGSCEVSFEDDCLHGKILFIDDLITYEGETTKQLREAFIASVDRYLEYCERTNTLANKPYSGSFNVRIGPELHRKAAIAAKAQHIKLNEFVCNALEVAVAGNDSAMVTNNTFHVTIVPQGDRVIEKFAVPSSVPTSWSNSREIDTTLIPQRTH